jgi:hypothetical protein
MAGLIQDKGRTLTGQNGAFCSAETHLSRRLRDGVFSTFFSATGFCPSVYMLLAPLRRLLSMKDELQQVFDSVPEDAPRSQLEPYRELILRWRRQGRSYRRICKLLTDKCGLKVGKTSLHEFVQRRSRPRKLHPEAEPQPATITPTPPDQADIRPRNRRSPDELAAQREAIRAAYNKPVVPTEEPEEVFVYDPDKPPINRNY